MSRLIDADAMKRNYPIMENDFGMVFNEGLHKKLDLEPTVKAIPIEKLEQIRAEIKAIETGGDCWELELKDEVLEIIDKAIKEVEQ